MMVLASDILRGDRNTFVSLSVLISNVRAYMDRRAVYNATYRELQSLTDRDLNDLGLSRSNIGSIAREAADLA